MSNSNVSIILSFLIPGLGQIYKGELLKGFSIFLFFIICSCCFIVPIIINFYISGHNLYNNQVVTDFCLIFSYITKPIYFIIPIILIWIMNVFEVNSK